MSTLTRTMTIALVTGAALFAAPVQAATSQDDIAACRVAMSEQGFADISNYRLRFETAKGNSRNRTIRLKAIPIGKGQAFRFTCSLKKNVVVALKTTSNIRLAQR